MGEARRGPGSSATSETSATGVDDLRGKLSQSVECHLGRAVEQARALQGGEAGHVPDDAQKVFHESPLIQLGEGYTGSERVHRRGSAFGVVRFCARPRKLSRCTQYAGSHHFRPPITNSCLTAAPSHHHGIACGGVFEAKGRQRLRLRVAAAAIDRRAGCGTHSATSS
jgi:hypothetical protein